MNVGEISFLKLNNININYRDTKETTINEFKKYFLLLLKNIWYNIRTINGCLSREKTVNNFWPLKIGSHGEKEIWFVKMSANSYNILEKLGHKPRTPYIRGRKNEFVSQRSSIFTIISIIYSSILKFLIKLRFKSILMYTSLVEFSLLTICLCINTKLLEQLFTIKERWLRIFPNI